MNQHGEKSQHLVNFLNRISQDVIQEMKESEKLLFKINMPPKLIESKLLNNPATEIDELQIDKIQDANALYFKPKVGVSSS